MHIDVYSFGLGFAAGIVVIYAVAMVLLRTIQRKIAKSIDENSLLSSLQVSNEDNEEVKDGDHDE
ncbi:MAG: hypothetical protein ACXQS5_03885 [Candidatus Methanospirareceae archaeon]